MTGRFTSFCDCLTPSRCPSAVSLLSCLAQTQLCMQGGAHLAEACCIHCVVLHCCKDALVVIQPILHSHVVPGSVCRGRRAQRFHRGAEPEPAQAQRGGGLPARRSCLLLRNLPACAALGRCSHAVWQGDTGMQVINSRCTTARGSERAGLWAAGGSEVVGGTLLCSMLTRNGKQRGCVGGVFPCVCKLRRQNLRLNLGAGYRCSCAPNNLAIAVAAAQVACMMWAAAAALSPQPAPVCGNGSWQSPSPPLSQTRAAQAAAGLVPARLQGGRAAAAEERRQERERSARGGELPATSRHDQDRIHPPARACRLHSATSQNAWRDMPLDQGIGRIKQVQATLDTDRKQQSERPEGLERSHSHFSFSF